MLRRESIRRLLKGAPKIRKVLGMIYVNRLLVMQREIQKKIFKTINKKMEICCI